MRGARSGMVSARQEERWRVEKEEASAAMTEVQSTKGSTRAHDGTRQHEISRRSSSDLPFLAVVHPQPFLFLFCYIPMGPSWPLYTSVG